MSTMTDSIIFNSPLWTKVYVIGSTSGHYKIGYSNNPGRRLKELQKTQGPYKYSIEYWWGFGDRKRAQKFEKYLHQEYSQKRVNGEWFDLSTTDLILLGSKSFEFDDNRWEEGAG